MGNKDKLTTEERSWILYDVGNSAFVLVMVTAIMPIFFKDFAASHLSDAVSTAYWGVANSTASLILALLAPVLGAMADYRDSKKRFFMFFLTLGVLFNFLLALIGQGQWLLCVFLFIAARVGWAGANIFYDSFLTDVTTPAKMDTVSAKGYGFGYIGSIIPFVVVIGLILAGGMQGGLPVMETKTGFVVVAIWWIVLSIPAIRNLRQKNYIPRAAAPVVESFQRVYSTLREMRQYRKPFLFLLAYFFYIDGVGTLISMSTAYGRDLGFGVTMLIVVLLFIQIIAFPCSLFFGRLAIRFSTKRMLLAGIAIYVVATFLAFLLASIQDWQLKTVLFWVIAFLIASAMGGIQALSRSYFGKLIPPEKSAEFFGFYNVFGKFAAILGPLLMGGVGALTGHTRWGILSIMFLFLLGGFFLTKVED